MSKSIRAVLSATQAELVTGSDGTKVTGAYTSDLLSDVLACAEEGDLLITIQAHKNTVAVASHVGIDAILVCGSRPIPEEMIEAAGKNDITICLTALNQFQASGKVYTLLS